MYRKTQNNKEKRKEVEEREDRDKRCKKCTAERTSHNVRQHPDVQTIWGLLRRWDRNRLRFIKQKGPEQRWMCCNIRIRRDLDRKRIREQKSELLTVFRMFWVLSNQEICGSTKLLQFLRKYVIVFAPFASLITSPQSPCMGSNSVFALKLWSSVLTLS